MAKLLIYIEIPHNLYTENDLGCRDAYNRMSSYKHYLRGLLNDLNVYKHFKYFYIPRYATSTGRTVSDSYFLQLQGNKLAKGFITFVQQPRMSSSDYAKLKGIIKNVFPELADKIFPNTLEEYTEELEGLFNQYVLSFFKEGTDLDTYPASAETLHEQLEWLAHTCKEATQDIRRCYILFIVKIHHEVDYNSWVL